MKFQVAVEDQEIFKFTLLMKTKTLSLEVKSQVVAVEDQEFPRVVVAHE